MKLTILMDPTRKPERDERGNHMGEVAKRIINYAHANGDEEQWADDTEHILHEPDESLRLHPPEGVHVCTYLIHGQAEEDWFYNPEGDDPYTHYFPITRG